MPLIYITGPSGAGKSTIRNELIKRGFEAHDTDEDGISAWYNNQTNELVERPHEADRTSDWYQKHDYRMSPERVKFLENELKTIPADRRKLPPKYGVGAPFKEIQAGQDHKRQKMFNDAEDSNP